MRLLLFPAFASTLVAAFFPQSQSLSHTKTMLFVDHGQSQFRERDALLKQRVRTDRELRGSTRDRLYRGAFFFCFEAAREPGNVHTQRQQQRGQFSIVLLRQNFGRRHDRRLKSVVDRLCGGKCGNNRFAATNVALQQSLHRMRRGEIGGDFPPGTQLCSSERKRQRLFERLRESVLRNQSRRGFGVARRAGFFHRQLLREHFVKLDAPPRRMGAFGETFEQCARRWMMQRMHAFGEIIECQFRADKVGQRVVEFVPRLQCGKRTLNQFSQCRLREARGGRIHWR